MDRGDFEVKCPFCKCNVHVLSTSEDSLLHPTSFYGITKQVQESIIMTLCPNINIAPVAFRYQNVYGPGQSLGNPYTGILSIFSNRIRSNKHIEIFEDGLESRDFVFIDDVANITAGALFSEETNRHIFNVGSGVAVSVMYVANKLKELFSSDVEIKVSGKYRIGDIRHNYTDTTKIQNIMTYAPKVSIDVGLSPFVDWVKKQNASPDLYVESLKEMKDKGAEYSDISTTKGMAIHSFDAWQTSRSTGARIRKVIIPTKNLDSGSVASA
jgi:dTDP-L-rhamnose 4-epimerase